MAAQINTCHQIRWRSFLQGFPWTFFFIWHADWFWLEADSYAILEDDHRRPQSVDLVAETRERGCRSMTYEIMTFWLPQQSRERWRERQNLNSLENVLLIILCGWLWLFKTSLRVFGVRVYSPFNPAGFSRLRMRRLGKHLQIIPWPTFLLFLERPHSKKS